MRREGALAGKHRRRQRHSDAAIQSCLTMKILFGIALRQSEPARRHRFEPAAERGLPRSPQ
jgi:hypothetical protein